MVVFMQKIGTLVAVMAMSGAYAQGDNYPPIVLRSNAAGATPVWAQNRAGAPANNTAVTLQSPVGSAGQAAIVNPTGQAVPTNTSSAAQPSAIVILANAPCPTTVKSWVVGAATCDASIPGVLSGQNSSGTDSAVPTNGAATFACVNGSFSATPNAGASCALVQCPSQYVQWGSPTCGASISVTNTGGSAGATSTNGNVGTASYYCSGSSWVYQGGSCAAPRPVGACLGGTPQVTGMMMEVRIGREGNVQTFYDSIPYQVYLNGQEWYWPHGGGTYRCQNGYFALYGVGSGTPFYHYQSAGPYAVQMGAWAYSGGLIYSPY